MRASTEGFNSPAVNVRGQSQYNAPASLGILLVTALADLSWIVAAIGLSVKFLNLSPIPDYTTIVTSLLGLFVLWVLFQRIFAATPGQMIWKTQSFSGKSLKKPKSFFEIVSSRLYQKELLTNSSTAVAAFITFSLLILAGTLTQQAFLEHPMFNRALEWELPAFTPEAGSKDWESAPFYYSLGAWPKSFAGKPVLYSLPYEKGPPHRFLGHIVMRWDTPDVQVTLAGPLTPKPRITTPAMRSCFTSSLISALLPQLWIHRQPFYCLGVRKRVLTQEVREMSENGIHRFSMRWVQISNPALPETEQMRGLYLKGWNFRRVEERFIFLNPQGALQVFKLERPNSAAGDEASRLFEMAIRSHRIFATLDPGRNWADRKISQIKLNSAQLSALNDDQFAIKIAEVQGALLSKMSVDPKLFDSYYHLAGTTALLARRGFQNKNPFLSAAAKPLIQATFYYASDISPQDPRTAEIQTLVTEMKQY